MFGETKYSISFFYKAAKINLNDRLADIGLGWSTNETEDPLGTILCLKGGVDAPKIFLRFK